MGASKITSCTQNACFKGKRSQRKFEERNVKFRFSLFEQAHLEQLIIKEAQPSKSSNVTLHKSMSLISSLDM